MNRLTKAQKDRVVQFCNVTGAAQGVAAECLQATSWSLERAVDHFYAAGMQAFAERAGPKVDRCVPDATDARDSTARQRTTAAWSLPDRTICFVSPVLAGMRSTSSTCTTRTRTSTRSWQMAWCSCVRT
jgi:hypothetical protein